MLCDHVHEALIQIAECKLTDQGLSFATHCLYPSFEPVRVFVSKIDGGYRVHDGGGVLQSAWDHCRDLPVATRTVVRYASMNALKVVGNQLTAEIPDASWLMSAVLSVANTSAAAAADVLGTAKAEEVNFVQRVDDVLDRAVSKSRIVRNYEVKGRSGRRYHFDFAVRDLRRKWILIDTVTPHSSSVSAKYVAFSDTRNEERRGLGVYENRLEDSDAALLKQVADLLPFASLASGLRAEMAGD